MNQETGEFYPENIQHTELVTCLYIEPNGYAWESCPDITNSPHIKKLRKQGYRGGCLGNSLVLEVYEVQK